MLDNDAELNPWGGEGGTNETEANWRERERRQRTVRFLMMFLLMLLLMDGEEQSQRRHSRDSAFRKKSRNENEQNLEQSLYLSRSRQDQQIAKSLPHHPRYAHLLERNQGKDFDFDIRSWADQNHELEKDEFELGAEAKEEIDDTEKLEKVFHYPWNASGFYRGEWRRLDTPQSKSSSVEGTKSKMDGNEEEKTRSAAVKFVNATQVESAMYRTLEEHDEMLGVYLLPAGLELTLPNVTIGAELKGNSVNSPFLRGGSSQIPSHPSKEKQDPLTLTKNSGRAAFQLYSRSVPAMREISVVDGFIKLYDSNTVGYSTRRDILLRVSGVLVHSLGRISLISSPSPGRAAFAMRRNQSASLRRVLMEMREGDSQVGGDIERILREPGLLDQPPHHVGELNYESEITSVNWPKFDPDNELISSTRFHSGNRNRFLTISDENLGITNIQSPPKHEEDNTEVSSLGDVSLMNDYPLNFVIPYPFVADDDEQSFRRARSPAARSMPPRERLLEANTGGCEFEISLNVEEEKWSVGRWRNLAADRLSEILRSNSALHGNSNSGSVDNIDITKNKNSFAKPPGVPHNKRSTGIEDQALVLSINGTIVSFGCGFAAELNATAIRTDWEHTTGKAINYSFYMMLTCLTQIVLLLRQLLHTQSQSAATRVSLLCIGWQTVLDALLCLVHIYLSLAMQPLFTAFASVAFFKLLIFCVIEMKYMAIILQARNANNGGNTLELLRRQIAMLHLRFYVALIATFLAFFYAWDSYRTIYLLALYSFWVPQIIQNVVTEAKHPLHPYYIHGMSLTRLVAPLYMFAVENNFLKEVYPDSPTNTVMCEMLIGWVGVQAIILQAQGHYGARFMIPARFLPPKFDYSRPIPTSLLPSEESEMTPSETLQHERGTQAEVLAVFQHDSGQHRTTGVARNRIKGNRGKRSESMMTSETVNRIPAHQPTPSFDCVICYTEIDIRNRQGYMLAPCDHLFHRECLVQWMDVKMECPICRTELPSL